MLKKKVFVFYFAHCCLWVSCGTVWFNLTGVPTVPQTTASLLGFHGGRISLPVVPTSHTGSHSCPCTQHAGRPNLGTTWLPALGPLGE